MSMTARTAGAAGQQDAADQRGDPAVETRAQKARLAFASFLMLFVELALIRWVTSNNVYVTKATNFVLLASFLGIGIGFLNARTRRDYLRWTPVTLLVLVGFVLGFPVILATLSGPDPYQGLGGSAALPQPVSLFSRQHFRMPEPVRNVRGLAQVVLMRGKATAGLGVGEIERQIVGDQRQRTDARGGEFG